MFTFLAQVLMYIIAAILLVFSNCMNEVFGQTQVNVVKNSIKLDQQLFASNRSISAGDSLGTQWYNIGDCQYFSLFCDIDGIATGFDLAVKYELSPFRHSSDDTTSSGFWKKDNTGNLELDNFVLADSTNGGKRYLSFHSGNSAITLARSIRIWFVNDGSVSAIINKRSKILGQ